MLHMVLLQREGSVWYTGCYYKGRVVWGTHGVVTNGGRCVGRLSIVSKGVSSVVIAFLLTLKCESDADSFLPN